VKKVKKGLLIALLVVGLVAVMGGVALAGGWTTITESKSHDPNDLTGPDGTGGPDGEAVWNAMESGLNPHGNFSSSTNKCRVCHAVHGANATSWRLLRDTSRATECNACHGEGGLTDIQPYRITTWSIRGEHTIGSDQIPDSVGVTSITGGLSCGNCHSVHGANTLSGIGATSNWDDKILRRDPNGNGQVLAADATGAPDTSVSNGKKTGFCADCHNKNSNWSNTGNDQTVADPGRPNKESHVQGPDGNGLLEVYGASSVQVAGWGTAESPQTTTSGCRACHAGSDAGNYTTDSSGRFPHRTPGNKLMFDSYSADNQEATGLNDAQRVVSNMDILCGKCHRDGGDIDGGTAGVGLTF
jgi:hypothetical protein